MESLLGGRAGAGSSPLKSLRRGCQMKRGARVKVREMEKGDKRETGGRGIVRQGRANSWPWKESEQEEDEEPWESLDLEELHLKEGEGGKIEERRLGGEGNSVSCTW